MNRVPLLLMLVLLCSPAAAVEFYAAKLSQENIERLPAIGMDGIGGIDDWFLTDGELCAVIAGKTHASYLSLTGGVLVDLWHCDAANDQWNSTHPQFNLQKDEIPETQEITAGFSTSSAFVETLATRAGMEATVRYALSGDEPGVLSVETRITRVAEGESLGMFGSLVLHPRGSLTPFTLDTEAGEHSRGADQPAVHASDIFSVLGSVAVADLQVLLGSRHVSPSITYGIRNDGASLLDAEGNTSALHHFLLGGQDFSLFGAFTAPFPDWWSRTPGMISFLGGLMRDLSVGDTFVLRQSMLVARGASAAAITDRVYSGVTVSGTLDTADAGIAVSDGQGKAITFVRPDAEGHFTFVAPQGVEALELRIETPWSNQFLPVELSAQSVALGQLDTGAVATLVLPRGEVMNLVFVGENGQPVFQSELLTRYIDGQRSLSGPESHRVSLAGTARDLREVQLPPGRYRVIASRGPEYSATSAEVRLEAGKSVTLDIAPPQRVVDTSHLVSADFHVHSGLSFDSSLLPEQRVIDFVAQGGEILVPTEHFVTYDIAHVVASLGLQDEVITFPGVEISGMARTDVAPTTIGHSNAFPVEADTNAFMGGSLPFESRRLGQVISDYKARFPDSIYQLNHPRDMGMDDDIAYLNHLSQGVAYDPALPLTEMPNALLLEEHPGATHRDIDFDVLELLNSKDMPLYELNRTDWFSFLRQDIYHVVTANSDSHVSDQLVAYPRNMLVLDDASLEAIKTEDIVNAVKAGRVYGTTGPIIAVSVSGVGPGGTLAAASGELAVVIDCADWVNVDQARIWVGGELHETLPARCGATVELAITSTADTFVFVEVIGQPSETYALVAPGYQPFAFANPIFLDVDGDGWRFGEAQGK